MKLDIRTRKYRAWNRIVGRMEYFTLQDIEKLAGKIQWQNLDIMDFTELQDKNKKDIYQGDVLTFDFGNEQEVKDWMKLPCYIVGFHLGYVVAGKGIKEKLFLHGFRFKYAEVLGNIYEHPELLKGMKEYGE